MTSILIGLALVAVQGDATTQSEAVQRLMAMPDAYAALDSIRMKITLQVDVLGEKAQVVSEVLAAKPNKFVINQVSRGPEGVDKRRAVCDGSVLAFPEPLRPERFLRDPNPYPQWAGNLRSFGSVMLDNGWPLGVMFRTKQESANLIKQLRNVRDMGVVKLPGGEVRRITGETFRADGALELELEVLIREDGLMRRLIIRSPAMLQQSTIAVDPSTVNVDPNVKFVTELTWDIEIEKDPKIDPDAFKLPPASH
jgi:hypothetical protein